MNNYTIHTEDLNSSLVFYRSLFNRMPDEMNPFEVAFHEPNLHLKIKETNATNAFEDHKILHLDIHQDELKETYQRMLRFTRLNQFKENCETLKETVGLTDPDGNKWVLGKYSENISFEKCYIKKFN